MKTWVANSILNHGRAQPELAEIAHRQIALRQNTRKFFKAQPTCLTWYS